MSISELSEQEQIRRNSLAELRKLGIEPYPAAKYEVTATAARIAAEYDPDKGNFQEVSIAGRIMSRRIMGSASFFELQDHTGRIQVYVKRDDICNGDPESTLYNKVFKKLLDIGDIVGIRGFAFITKTGELSVHCKELTVLSKSLRPLPVVKEKDGQVYDAFSDPELRYRQRYVDLIVNPQVREVFLKRSKIVNTMRAFFNEQGYVEVETPILQSIPGGASARPFVTHHNALDIPLYLRIANELYLKKLIVGGFDGVYEFGKDFRNEGMDRTHNPEFTVMEIYVAYKDYIWMMGFVEAAPEQIADILGLHFVKIVGVKSRVLHLRIRAVILCKAPVPQLRRVKAVLFQLLYGVLMLALLVSQPLFIHAFLLTGAVRGMPVTSEQGGMTIFKIGFLRRMALAAVQQAVLAGVIALVGSDFHHFGNNIGKIVHRLSPSLQV